MFIVVFVIIDSHRSCPDKLPDRHHALSGMNLIIEFPECSQQMNFLLKWWHKYGCYTAIKYEHQANESSLEIWRIFRRGSRTMAQGDLQVYLLYEGRMSSQIRRPKRMSIYAVPAVHLPHWTGLKTAKGAVPVSWT